MKILIIGDSYVHNYVPVNVLAERILSKKPTLQFHEDHPYFSWHTQLSQINPSWEITANGEGGCDNWWIYSNFLENYKNYDKVIITWTAESRYSWKTEDGVWFHTSNIASAKNKYDSNWRGKDIYKLMMDFLPQVHYEDYKRYKTFNNLMRDNIKLLRPDTMFINCFNPNDTHLQEDPRGERHFDSLFALTRYENNQLGITGPAYWKTPELDQVIDCRCSHLTKASHIILAEQIVNAIELGATEFKIDIASFERDMTTEYHKEFWTKRDVMKYADKYYNAGMLTKKFG